MNPASSAAAYLLLTQLFTRKQPLICAVFDTGPTIHWPLSSWYVSMSYSDLFLSIASKGRVFVEILPQWCLISVLGER